MAQEIEILCNNCGETNPRSKALVYNAEEKKLKGVYCPKCKHFEPEGEDEQRVSKGVL